MITGRSRRRSVRLLGAPLLRRSCVAAIVVAALAAFQAPLPWSVAGLLASLLAIGSILWLERSRGRREAENSSRFQVLEEDLAASVDREGLYAALLSALPVGVVAMTDGFPVYANRVAVEVLGDRAAQPGAPMPSAVREVLEEAADGRPASGQFTHGLPRRITEVTARPIGDDGLVILRLVDMTERRQADRIRQDFVISASHELKTPVAAIQAAAETVLVALEDDLDSVFEFSGRILDNAIRMSRIVTNLLDLSRLESDTLRVEPLDLADVVAQEVDRFVTSRPSIDFAATSTPMMGNPSDLALACRNLLENAVRHTPDGGWVRATVGIDQGEATVVVADSGTGIPAASLPRIFERFYRVDEARSRATGGTGLGLAIVKHVAEIHGGRVEVESRLGEGSTFRLRLPIRIPDPAS